MNSPLLPPSTSCKAKKKQTFEISILLQWLLLLQELFRAVESERERETTHCLSLMWHSSTYPPTSLGQCKKNKIQNEIKTFLSFFVLEQLRAWLI